MTDCDHDFVDSNIFLSVPLNDHDKSSCEKYLNNNYCKITSQNVKNESINFINKLFNLSKSILSFFQEIIVKDNIPDSQVHLHVSSIEDSFLKKFDKLDFPFNFKRKKFVKLVENFFKHLYFLFKEKYYKSTKEILLEEFSDIDKYYYHSSKILFICFNKVTICNVDVYDDDNVLIDLLNKNGIHNPDSRILVDAYRICISLNKRLFFVTKDKTILNKYPQISKLYDFRICPKNFNNN